ncbi:MAG: hypothetical protein SCABRO_03575 [Candidatus Scalindua brodae]|uniref:Radical SAM core domain-containing protein n=1 Tax=Candidatus Scalindua brodae TaxID=237368 RepID=A0A0B0EDC1_9BACT|nr:MAG: hypothetical protein SCABRO_03575 [Candidatus Scalindua brodae]
MKGIHYLQITGGEPMLYPEILMMLLENCASNGIVCGINSNLTVLTPDIIKTIRECNVEINTSIHSWNHLLHDKIAGNQGAFIKTKQNIKLLKEVGAPVNVNMVVMKSNCSDVYQTGLFAKSLGIDSFSAGKVVPSVYSNNFNELKLDSDQVVTMIEALILLKEKDGMLTEVSSILPACIIESPERFKEILLNKPCSAGKTMCAISADGSVKPCIREPNSFGNIFIDDLSVIWDRWESWKDDSLLPQLCKDCLYLTKCGGGCRLDCAYNGDICSYDPYAIHKSNFGR